MAACLGTLLLENNYEQTIASPTHTLNSEDSEQTYEDELTKIYGENSPQFYREEGIYKENSAAIFGEKSTSMYEEDSANMFGENPSNYSGYYCYNCKSTSLDYCVCMRVADPEDEDDFVMLDKSTSDKMTSKPSAGMTEGNKTADSYCEECGAATWSACICMRCLDPEDETEISAETKTSTLNKNCCKGFEQRSTLAKDLGLPALGMTDPSNHYTTWLKSDLTTLQSQLKGVQLGCSKAKQNLAMSCVTFLHELKSFRKKLNQHLDNLEKDAKSDLNSLYESLDRDINEDLETCRSTADLAEELAQYMDKPKQDAVDKEQCSRQIGKLKRIADKIATSENTGNFEFAFHTKLKNLTNDVKSMGQIIHSYKDTTEPDQKSVVDVDIRASNDKTTACISGICQMKNGCILVADRNNQNLKYLDANYRIIGQCQLNAAPRGLCCISECEVAVALNTNTVQFVSIGKTMTVLRSMALDHQCWGIACFDKKLYVSDWAERVYIYSTSGTLINVVHKDTNGHNIFTNSRHIAVNENLHQVYVCDRTKGLVILNERGQVLSTSNHDDLKLPCGVCVTTSGHAYISGSLSHNIIQIQNNNAGPKQTPDEKGENSEILTKPDGVIHPGAMCYDNKQKKLIVASFPPFGGCDKLRIYNMNKQ